MKGVAEDNNDNTTTLVRPDMNLFFEMMVYRKGTVEAGIARRLRKT